MEVTTEEEATGAARVIVNSLKMYLPLILRDHEDVHTRVCKLATKSEHCLRTVAEDGEYVYRRYAHHSRL